MCANLPRHSSGAELKHYIVAHSPSGALTFLDTKSGEYLHRYFGPVQEAQQVYAIPSGAGNRPGRMCICDLGLGAGFNVIETLKAAALNPELSELEIYSFDLHLQGIDLLIESIASFPEVLSWKPALEQLKNAAQLGNPASFRIRDICPTSVGNAVVKWNVRLGDALEKIAEVPDQTIFDAIFYDMFSYQSAPDFWKRAAIEKFARRLGSDGVFTTYSTATPVRAILLSLGCWVGDGAYVTTKMRSTIASKNPRRILEPLAPEWLTRFKRSGKPFFEAEDAAARAIIYENVVQHPQFVLGFEDE